MDAFSSRYKSLNARQREAVDSIEGPVMVIAGPGTGKTTILTLRIANILKRTDTPPSGILAITYTDAGVKAMRAKLREVIGGRAHEVQLHTFHSFASAMIAEYSDHFLHLSGLRVMTDIDQESLIRSLLEEDRFSGLRPIGKPDAHVPGILRAIDGMKREAYMPDKARSDAAAEIERIKSDDSSLSTRGASKGKLKAEALERIEKCERTLLLADIYEAYEKTKREKKLIDFNDLIIDLLVALRNDQLLLRLIQERFLYLLVDEHQDTNDSQNLVVALIAEFFETPNIFIVGDEKQAIYRFQGASVENFLLLQSRWPAMKVISLDTNYRSHQGILDAAFSMIEKNYEGDEHRSLRVELRSGSKLPSKPIEAVIGEDVPAIEERLVSSLRSVIDSEPDASVAVITRRNRDLERAIRLLESHGIPVSSERSVDIFHHPAGAAFFDLLGCLADPVRTDLLAKTVAAGLWGLSFEDMSRALRALRSGDAAESARLLPALAHIRRKMLNDGAVSFLVDAAEMSGYSALVASDPSYVHVWRGIAALAGSLAREGGIGSPLELMEAMLVYRQSAESKTVKVPVGAPDLQIRAMTAHGSKGLEFDYVFLPYATEEAWVGRPRGSSFVLPEKRSSDHDIRDLRRLFYVALTRARKHAVILTAMEESDGKALTPLRFIDELDQDSVVRVPVPRAEPKPPSGALRRLGDNGADKLSETAKQAIMASGLSVTALNHFIECPNKFIYESVLRMPQAPSASAEKGTAMHEAISRVWALPDRPVERIEETIAAAVRERVDGSLLPAHDKEALKEELLSAAPAVARALKPHFDQPGKAYAERWMESTVDMLFGGETLAVPVHGKLDAVIDDGREIKIYDYKTRKAMSASAVKGETKGSDGGYFRQLAFYRLLAESEPRWRGRSQSAALVFVSPDEKGRCPIVALPVSEDDVSMIRAKIRDLVESVWSGEISAARCGDPSCEWCGLRGLGRA